MGVEQTSHVACSRRCVGGTATSTAVFGTQTYALGLSFPGSVSSTGGPLVCAIIGHLQSAQT